MKECVKRQPTRYYRLPSYNVARVAMQFMMAVMVALIYLREIENGRTRAILITAAMFLSAIPSNLSLQNAVPSAMAARPVFYRDLSSRTYISLAHHVSIGKFCGLISIYRARGFIYEAEKKITGSFFDFQAPSALWNRDERSQLLEYLNLLFSLFFFLRE